LRVLAAPRLRQIQLRLHRPERGTRRSVRDVSLVPLLLSAFAAASYSSRYRAPSPGLRDSVLHSQGRSYYDLGRLLPQFRTASLLPLSRVFFPPRTSRQTSWSKTRLIPPVHAGFTPQRPSEYRASRSMALLPAPHRPCIRFLFVTSGFCLRLPPDPASRPRPCLWLQVPLTTALRGLTPHIIRAMSGALKNAPRDVAQGVCRT
jgi:hypothetical protein